MLIGVHLGRIVPVFLACCRFLLERVFNWIQVLSILWASYFSFRSFSKKCLADWFILEADKKYSYFTLNKPMDFDKVLNIYCDINIRINSLLYRICSVMCSTTCFKTEDTPPMTPFSLCSSRPTTSLTLSEGTRFFL